MKNVFPIFLVALLLGLAQLLHGQEQWISLFNENDLTGWFPRGEASWYVKDGILIGEDGMGHLYSDAIASDFEAKGMFRISGDKTNSGFYFRAMPPDDNPDGFPRKAYRQSFCFIDP